eukprot:69001_1
MATCTLTITFEDLRLGEPLVISLNCSKSSPYFEYYLRRELHRRKRVSPIKQQLEEINSNTYKLIIRERNPINQLTVHGHHYDEYILNIDNNDTIIDLKFLLAPLIDTKPEYIQFNYNTLRKLNDNENVIKANCLSPNIVIMWWLEFENQNPNESPIYRSVSHFVKMHSEYQNFGESIRKICNKYGNNVETFGIRKYMNKNDLSVRGEYEYINYKIINDKITKIAAAFCELGLSKKLKSKIGLCSRNRREWLLCDYACSLQSLVSIPLYSTLDANAIEYITNHAQIQLIVVDKDQCNDIYKLRKNNKVKSLKYIILMDYELPDKIYAEKNKNKFDYTISELD